MPTLADLGPELLGIIAAFLGDYDVVQLLFSCRQLRRAIRPPRTSQLCPGTWRVPQSALPDIGNLVQETVDQMLASYEDATCLNHFPHATLQWSYLLDFTGELQCQLQGTKCAAAKCDA